MRARGLFFSAVGLMGILGVGSLSGTAEARPRVVIDPGHGGRDPGAVARGAVREKEISLAVARYLAEALRPEADVTLTRKGDRFVSLEKRTEIANQARCDFFVSIHANASRRRAARGVEIYYLNNATDEASRRLADRENAGSPSRLDDLEMILSKLIQNAVVEEAADASREIRQAIEKRLKGDGTPATIKTALFYVLVGNKCPSLLVEAGFLTNGKEAKKLQDAAYQRRLAEGIAEGIRHYLRRTSTARRDL